MSPGLAPRCVALSLLTIADVNPTLSLCRLVKSSGTIAHAPRDVPFIGHSCDRPCDPTVVAFPNGLSPPERAPGPQAAGLLPGGAAVIDSGTAARPAPLLGPH